MATHFLRHLLPPVRTYYERELGKFGPTRRGWAMGRCPFHRSKSGKSFSVNLESGGFHCFGCDARGGDILAFVMLRDRLNFEAAAQSLGAWNSSPSLEAVRNVAEQNRERERDRQAEELRQSEERRQRLKLRDEVHTAARIHREASDRLTELHRGDTPVSDIEEESCWSVLQLALDDLRECERAYCAVAKLECEW